MNISEHHFFKGYMAHDIECKSAQNDGRFNTPPVIFPSVQMILKHLKSLLDLKTHFSQVWSGIACRPLPDYCMRARSAAIGVDPLPKMCINLNHASYWQFLRLSDSFPTILRLPDSSPTILRLTDNSPTVLRQFSGNSPTLRRFSDYNSPTIFYGGRECQRPRDLGEASGFSERPPGSRTSGFSECRVLGVPGSRGPIV